MAKKPREPEGMDMLKRRLRMTLNAAVRGGDVTGDEALAAVMTVAATMVAAVTDDAVRQEYVDAVVENFPGAVTIAREVPVGATMQ